jgi:FkbM family methyltransferase
LTLVYCPDQILEICPYLIREPQWLLLGGPADSNEAQTAVRQWPEISGIGIEPSKGLRQWQLENDWPMKFPLLPYALAESCREATFQNSYSNWRSGTLLDRELGEKETVETITLDSLAAQYGPFNDAILWLDIEGYEYKALQGAEELFRRKSVLLVNLEITEILQETTQQIEAWMDNRNFRCRHKWGYKYGSRSRFHDRIYVPEP